MIDVMISNSISYQQTMGTSELGDEFVDFGVSKLKFGVDELSNCPTMFITHVRKQLGRDNASAT